MRYAPDRRAEFADSDVCDRKALTMEIENRILGKKLTINVKGRLVELKVPAIMGILNVTPDSFYAASRMLDGDVTDKARQLIEEGADIVDVGGYSTRPGADDVSAEEELRRVLQGVKAVKEACKVLESKGFRMPEAGLLISVDTFRAEVAEKAVEAGADIVNDISAGLMDREMIPTVARLKVPYIIMHTRGTPATMAQLTDYPAGVVAGVAAELQARVNECRLAGIADLIVDPGFGFAKTVEQNYELMAGLRDLDYMLGSLPMLVGISRKSMIYKPLGLTPAETLPGTDALNALAVERGAAILRVHDVAAARQVAEVSLRSCRP